MKKNINKVNVLLVDDEEEFVKALSERIQMRDHGSEIAFDGKQALKKIEDKRPDVMVLDLKMPGMDGLEVLRHVKKIYPGLPVIILSGHGTEKDEKEALRLGAFQYLKKPVKIETLLKHVNNAYKSKIEKPMAAAAFAEAGEFTTAKDILYDENNETEPTGK